MSDSSIPRIASARADQVVRLQRAQTAEATAMLARAFRNDPATIYLVPDPVRREALTRDMFRVMVREAMRYGEVYTTPGKVEGVAMWYYPGEHRLTLASALLTGTLLPGFRVMRRLGHDGGKRSQAIADCERQLHDRYMPQAHWYLAFLGVDPSSQGKGIGSALMQPILEQARMDGVPCYLETSTEKNVRFYEKRGFEVVGEARIDRAGPPVWAMVRKPA